MLALLLLTAFTLITLDYRAQGGGVFTRGYATIAASTFSGNSAPVGGGLYKAIYSVYGDPFTTMTITNSTFADNGSQTDGSGIETLRPTTIMNSTIAGNASANGGGGVLLDGAATLTLQSTIIAMNADGDASGEYSDLVSTHAVTVAGANDLVRVATGVTLPVGTLSSDPKLLPLARNGGPTMTMALDRTSPAVDAGNNVAQLATEQRGIGFVRVYGPAADIGAFELFARRGSIEASSRR